MYREHVPRSPVLGHLVERVWTRRCGPDEGLLTHRVLPDGCMDVLFSLGGPPRERSGGAGRPPFYVVGTMTAPVEVGYQGAVDLVGVRFRPGAAPAFVDVPAAELTDGILPLQEAWGALAGETAERLAEAGGERARLEVVEGALLYALRRGGERLDDGVLAACRAVEAAPAALRVEDVAREAGVGRRQLERRFRASVGLSPAAAVRVQRFRRALRLLEAEPAISLARVALSAGYYDQPHLTREFRALADETPGGWRARQRADDASVQDRDVGDD